MSDADSPTKARSEKLSTTGLIRTFIVTNGTETGVILYLFLVVVILFSTLPIFGSYVTIGVDSAYNLAINIAHYKDLQFGRDLLHPYGPMGFLLAPLPVGSNYEVASVFYFLLYLSLTLLMVTSVMESHDQMLTRVALVLLVYVFLEYEFMFIFDTIIKLTVLVFLVLQRFVQTRSRPWFVAAVMISAVGMLIKAQIGMTLIGMLFGFLLFMFCQEGRRTEFWRLLWLSVVLYLLGITGIWFAVYGNLKGFGRYFTANFWFSVGNSSAMSLNPANSWGLLLLSLFMVAWVFLHNRGRMEYVFVACTYFFPMVLGFKYSFARQDIHVLYIAALFVSGIVVLQLSLKERKHTLKTAVFLVIPLVLFITGVRNSPGLNWGFENMFKSSKDIFGTDGTKIYFNILVGHQDYKWELGKLSLETLRHVRLPPEVLTRIGDSTVDIYPYETVFIAADNLNWSPRPVFQSFMAYTPWLDEQNARFLRADQAPEYILWPANHMSSIDNRYVLNDEPRTVYEIFRNYRVEMRQEGVLVLRRSGQNLAEPLDQEMFSADWNTWIPVPAKVGEITRARIKIEPNFVGKTKKILYKEGDVFIDYMFMDDSVIRHRIIVDNAPSGLWINPYLLSLVPAERSTSLLSRELNEQDTWPKDRLDINIMSASENNILGIVSQPDDGQILNYLKIVLRSDKETYYLKPEWCRTLYRTAGYDNNDYEGFYLDLHNVALNPGDYDIGVLANLGSGYGFSWSPKRLAIVTGLSRKGEFQGGRTVKKIRLTNKQTEFYEDNIYIKWQLIPINQSPAETR